MLADFDLSSPPASSENPMKSALLKLASARRELENGPSYGRAVEVQLAEKDVNVLANEERRKIHIVGE